MKPFKLLLLTALLTTPLATTASGADDDWFRGRLFAPEVVLKNAASLKLTDSQRKIIRQEIVKVQTAVAGVDADLLEDGLAIQEAIEKMPVDRSDVLARADRVFAAEARKKRAWIEMLVNIKNALTPAQFAALQSLTGEAGKP